MKNVTFALALALVSGAAACSGTAANVPTATAQAAATKAPLSVQVSGPLRPITESFGDVPLRADQRAAIERELAQAETRHASARPVGKEVVLLLADQIERGSLDDAALTAKIDALTAAMQPAREEDRKAIQRVHDLLDASQRAALVDALEAKHEERMGGHGGPMGHGFGRGAGLRQLAEELDLTADQKAKIMDALRAERDAAGHDGAGHDHARRSFGDMKERRDHAVEAFKTDGFQIDKDMPPIDPSQGPKRMVEHGLRVAHAALPVLTAEQRQKAAKLLRERADSFGELPR